MKELKAKFARWLRDMGMDEREVERRMKELEKIGIGIAKLGRELGVDDMILVYGWLEVEKMRGSVEEEIVIGLKELVEKVKELIGAEVRVRGVYRTGEEVVVSVEGRSEEIAKFRRGLE